MSKRRRFLNLYKTIKLVFSTGFERRLKISRKHKPPVSHLMVSCALKTRVRVLFETVSATSLSPMLSTVLPCYKNQSPSEANNCYEAPICLINKTFSNLLTGLLRSSGHHLLTVLLRVWTQNFKRHHVLAGSLYLAFRSNHADFACTQFITPKQPHPACDAGDIQARRKKMTSPGRTLWL